MCLAPEEGGWGGGCLCTLGTLVCLHRSPEVQAVGLSRRKSLCVGLHMHTARSPVGSVWATARLGVTSGPLHTVWRPVLVYLCLHNSSWAGWK